MSKPKRPTDKRHQENLRFIKILMAEAELLQPNPAFEALYEESLMILEEYAEINGDSDDDEL